MQLKPFSLKCVFTNMHRWGHAGSSAATDSQISSHCIQVVYFVSSGRCALSKWKVMRKSTCWARSLPFSHIIRDWSLLPFPSLVSGLNWEIVHLKFMHIFLWNTHCVPDAAAQLGNVLHFIKKIPSQPLSGLETRLFINEPFFPLWFLHILKWVKTSWNPSFLLICQGYCELSCLQPQRHQTATKGEQIGETVSEWVKSLHLVYTECNSKALSSSVRNAILLTHPTAHFITLSWEGNCTEGAIRTEKLWGCHYFRI